MCPPGGGHDTHLRTRNIVIKTMQKIINCMRMANGGRFSTKGSVYAVFTLRTGRSYEKRRKYSAMSMTKTVIDAAIAG